MVDVGHRWMSDVEMRLVLSVGHAPSPSIEDQLRSLVPLQLPAREPMYMNMGERSAGRRPVAPTDRPARVDAGRTWVFRLLAVTAPAVAAAVPAWYGLTGHPWEAFSTG